MENNKNNLFPILNARWTVRGCREKKILYDFKNGASEERYDLTSEIYEAVRLADGNNSLLKIQQKLKFNPMEYFNYLNQLENNLITFNKNKSGKRRYFIAPYQGDDFLGRALIHLTSRCNVSCKHCYMGGIDWGRELSPKEIMELISQLEEINCYAVSLTGGEPLALKNIIKILEEFDKREIKVEGIFTNGTLLTETLVDRIEKIQQIPFFISLDAPVIELHEEFRGKEKMFELVIDNFRMLARKGVKIFANTSLTSLVDDKNLIRKFYHLIKELKVYRWRVSRPFPQGNWIENEKQFGISLERELAISDQIFDLWVKDGCPFDLELGHLLRYIDGIPQFMNYKENDYVCDYYRERITIMPNGDVSACPMLIRPPFIIGNLRRQSLRAIWENKKMRYYKDLRIRDILDKKCRGCQVLSQCGLGCRACPVLNGLRYEDIDQEACTTYLSPKYRELKDKFYQKLFKK